MKNPDFLLNLFDLIKTTTKGTSQGNLDALQYMRPGAQEDPWISSGHHPDQIVYGENGDANSWHTGAGDALQMGGANVCKNEEFCA